MSLTRVGKLPHTALMAAWTLSRRLLPLRALAAIFRKYGCAGHR